MQDAAADVDLVVGDDGGSFLLRFFLRLAGFLAVGRLQRSGLLDCLGLAFLLLGR